MLRTHQQILTEFGLRMSTLDFLLGTKQINPDRFESRGGKEVIELTPDDIFILQCSRNSIYNFGEGSVNKGKVRGIHPLPFHRFLLLRFITCTLEETYEEIFTRQLLPSKAKYPIENLKEIKDRFLALCPDSIRPLIEQKELQETSPDKEKFKIFLRAIDAEIFYDDPGTLSQHLWLIPYRLRLEILLTTDNASEKVIRALFSLMNLSVKEEGINLYRRGLYSLHDLTSDDRAAYFKLLLPTERDLKTAAVGHTIAYLAMEQGLYEASEELEILREVKKRAMEAFLKSGRLKTPNGAQFNRHHLDTYLKALSMTEGKPGIPETKYSVPVKLLHFNGRDYSTSDLIDEEQGKEWKNLGLA